MFDTKEMVNEVNACGRVFSVQSAGSGEKLVTLVTKAGTRLAFPRFVCKNDVVPDSVSRDSRIKVFGHVDTVRRIIRGSSIVEQLFVADRISIQPTRCEERFGTKGHFYLEGDTEASFTGTILDIKHDGDWHRIKANVNTLENPLIISVSLFMKHDPKLYMGDRICMVCNVTTPVREEKNKRRHYFTDFMVRDIALLDSSGRKVVPEKGERKGAGPKRKNVAQVIRTENIDKKVDDAVDTIKTEDINDALMKEISSTTTFVPEAEKQRSSKEDEQKKAVEEAIKGADFVPDWAK